MEHFTYMQPTMMLGRLKAEAAFLNDRIRWCHNRTETKQVYSFEPELRPVGASLQCEYWG